MARKTLYELTRDKPEIEIEEVDIVTNPLRAWKDGVRFIPTLKCGDKSLSGFILSREEIQDFLNAASR
jgi:hypothetical protein